jgi:hypothetical protein
MRRVSSLGFSHAPRTPRSSRASLPNNDRGDDNTLEHGRRDVLGLTDSAVSLSGEDAFEFTRGDSSSPIAFLEDA